MAKDIRKQAKEIEQKAAREISDNEPRLVRMGSGLLLFILGAAVTAIGLLAIKPAMGPPDLYAGGPDGAGAAASNAAFTPPDVSAIPSGPEGDAIRHGMALFNMTYAEPEAMKYVGNGMACTNCHIDGGRRANSAPMWSAWVSFPQYRKKNNQINTISDRIKGCFLYSMNAQNSPTGGPPPETSSVYRDMEIYFAWLAKGAPQYAKLPGGGFLDLAQPKAGYDPARGAIVYNKVCSACHGPAGQGAAQPDGTVVYPALWGPHSFNWGAGMGSVKNAAGFIKANMPFDKPGTLNDQDAWDVAAYMDSQERPKDPRQTGTVAANAAKNFQGSATYYGKQYNGHLLGTGVAGAPYPKVPVLTKGQGVADPAVAAMAQASQGS